MALEALVRFSEEELKHQALFRRLEAMAGGQMPAGYAFLPDPNEVAAAVLSKSTWAVPALTLHIELFTQVHYKESIHPDPELSELWKGVFRYHWMEESQHAVMDELEWLREDAGLTDAERDRAVTDLIDLVGAVDGNLRAQAARDAGQFAAHCDRAFSDARTGAIHATMLKAYRWQHIVSGVQVPRFKEVSARCVTAEQGRRIHAALAPVAIRITFGLAYATALGLVPEPGIEPGWAVRPGGF